MIGNLMRLRPGCGPSMALALLLIFAVGEPACRADQKLDQLKVGLDTYEKVTITTKTATDLFITHSKGFANIKVADLDPETKVMLGYAAPKPKHNVKESLDSLNLQVGDVPLQERIDEVKAQLLERWQTTVGDINPQYILLTLAGVAGFIYLFTCYCFSLICRKTGTNPGLVVWLPILQLFPILKSAGMRSWWFFAFVLAAVAPAASLSMFRSIGPSPLLLLFLVPHAIAAIGMIVWCFKICPARGVGSWVGVLLLLPITNLFAFLYLAFANPVQTGHFSPKKVKTQRWTKTRATDTSFFYQS